MCVPSFLCSFPFELLLTPCRPPPRSQLGGLGHLAVQFSRKMGFKTVVVSRGTDKKDLAFKLGAHHYIDSEAEDAAEALQKLGGAKVAACVAPSGKAMESLIGGLAVGGCVPFLPRLEPALSTSSSLPRTDALSLTVNSSSSPSPTSSRSR